MEDILHYVLYNLNQNSDEVYNVHLEPLLIITKFKFFVLVLKSKIEDGNLRHFSKLKITFCLREPIRNVLQKVYVKRRRSLYVKLRRETRWYVQWYKIRILSRYTEKKWYFLLLVLYDFLVLLQQNFSLFWYKYNLLWNVTQNVPLKISQSFSREKKINSTSSRQTTQNTHKQQKKTKLLKRNRVLMK